MKEGFRHRHGIKGRCEVENLVDEFLEEVWISVESSQKAPEPGMQVEADKDTEIIEKALEEGYLKEEEGKIYLTDKGYERAKQLIRSHRLAERLLTDVLDFSEEEVEDAACRYEHMLDEYAIDSVCTLLGHPRSCPHGNKIPEGRCCLEGEYRYRPLVVPLTELEPGETAEVKYLGTGDSARLSHLTSFGFVPGQRIRLIRKRPAYVVEVDETTVSFDDEIARLIFVKPKKHILKKAQRRNWLLRMLKKDE